jgi:hypothetical protein
VLTGKRGRFRVGGCAVFFGLCLAVFFISPIPFVVTPVPGVFVDHWPVVPEQNLDPLPSVLEAKTRFDAAPNSEVNGRCFPRCSWFGLQGRAKARYWQKLGIVEVISRSRPRYRKCVWDLDRGVERVYGSRPLRYSCGFKRNDRCLSGAMELRRNGLLYRVEIYGLVQSDFCEVARFYAQRRSTEFDQAECESIVSKAG